jgi:hypothetical protein
MLLPPTSVSEWLTPRFMEGVTMTEKLRWIRWMSLMVISVVLLTSCRNATGGGWIPSAAGTGKATFGFTVHCRDTAAGAHVSGQLEYQDKPLNIRLHGVVKTTLVQATCAEFDFSGVPSGTTFGGAYRPQPTGTGGLFLVAVHDNGEPGKLDDEFCISLFDGVYHGYQNCRALGAGNIQVRNSR